MKTIVITGTSSGIGKAIALDLLDQNYHIIGICRHPDQFSPHPNYTPIPCDLSKPKQIISTIRHAIAQNTAINAFISNAGYPFIWTDRKPISRSDLCTY